MRIYRLHVREHQAGSTGYEFFTSRRKATKAECDAKGRDDVAAVDLDGPHEIQLTKSGVLSALNRFARHADNG